MRKYILVGAKPGSFNESANNPGGQLTASKGLYSYAQSNGDELHVIDTLQTSFPVPPIRERLKKGLRRIKELIALLAKGNVEGLIVFACAGFSFYERVLMCGLARLYGVKSVFFMRDGFFQQFVEKSKVTYLIVKLLLRLPHVMGAQGESWVTVFKQLGVSDDKIVVVRNWLSKEFPVRTTPISLEKGQKPKFIFVGWLVEDKGVLELIEACENLSRDYAFEMQLVGDGSLMEQLEARLVGSDLSQTISLLGWRSPEQVLELLRTSHIFVLPSKAEGFPNAMLEAMAIALPCICTNVGAIADSLKNGVNGALLETGSSEEIASAMKQYLENTELIECQSAEAISIVQNQHSLEVNCAKLFSQFA
ncbi:hypothetical protein A3762_09905 [Oleiphilus sp. HI0125]|uniref:glycosyltransferase family 4 protein n=1 Tax=Oleiphilus sp. HI0125 TaxID=1822266 RepID=UPI0007C39BEB|nr:glycosyltransferase family 4 protein [Oleiphilus sp. HI0125]KZZ57477.1 hypothetical protein A3762_09905 [Oleiphilus sp. HI0125]